VLLFSPVVYADEGLSEQRLFFTDQQREKLDASSAGDARDEESAPVSAIANDQPSVIGSTHSVAENMPAQVDTHSFSVFFNGLVTGREGIQLLINGLTCQLIPVRQAADNESASPIDCPHLNALPFSYLWQRKHGQLLVQLDGQTRIRLDRGGKF